MDTRKVQEMGGGTVVISLPKAWASRNKVVRGTSVAVEELSPRRLLVRPLGGAAREAREVKVGYPRENLSYVINDLTGAYLIGADFIRIEGRQVISREDREALKALARRLIGLEIMEEDSKAMVLQFLPEPSSLEPEKITRRMASLIQGMLRDTREGIAQRDAKMLSLIAERDDEVDRLYFLLVRAIRSATIDPETAERFNLTPVECLDYRVLASFLESIGDTIGEASRRASEEPPSDDAARWFAEAFETIEVMEDLAIRSFLTNDVEAGNRAHLELREMREKVSQLSREALKASGVSAKAMVDLLGLVDTMTKILVDISDLAIPRYRAGVRAQAAA